MHSIKLSNNTVYVSKRFHAFLDLFVNLLDNIAIKHRKAHTELIENSTLWYGVHPVETKGKESTKDIPSSASVNWDFKSKWIANYS